MDYYQILQVHSDCGFGELKKAYYRAAKHCHPDLFGNDSAKTREFQLLVQAFDVLSDPVRRHAYDQSNRTLLERFANVDDPAKEPGAIMDDAASDVLEELIVGNNAPPESSLATLLSDLQKTDVFMFYREGQNYLYQHRCHAARRPLGIAVARAPGNIVFHVCFARALAGDKAFRLAKVHYKLAIELGEKRVPRQNLLNIRRELANLKKRVLPWYLKLFAAKEEVADWWYVQGADELMRAELSRAIAKAARKELRAQKKDARPALPDGRPSQKPSQN